MLKDGARLGQKRLTAIDTALAGDLYDKLLVIRTTDDDGTWWSASGAPRSITR